MYLRSLQIQHLKLFGQFDLDFETGAVGLRKWTAIIGENGTGKTALLQAIALAAAGRRQINTLTEKAIGPLRDRRTAEKLSIVAEFSLPDEPGRGTSRDLPGIAVGAARGRRFGVRSTVTQAPDETSLDGSSEYVDAKPLAVNARDPLDQVREPLHDPLDRTRATNQTGWFTVAYGVSRALPFAGELPRLERPSVERLKSLFDPQVTLTSTAFANYFQTEPDKSARYERALRKALLHAKQLLPGVLDVQIQGSGGVRGPGDLAERHRFTQSAGVGSIELPLNSLSHGYQSTVAWIADLIGHYTLESHGDFEPEEMVGLVLIDELDLYLHPTWQVVLVRALKRTFPKLQFVFTTHSPLVLAALDPREDQVVRLARDVDTGSIQKIVTADDPRLLTASELLQLYFDLDDLHPDPAGRKVREYLYVAANPYRSDADDAKLAELRRDLATEGIDPHYEPVPRKPFVRGRP